MNSILYLGTRGNSKTWPWVRVAGLCHALYAASDRIGWLPATATSVPRERTFLPVLSI